MTHDVYTLPPDLPAPVDDGAADHLLGTMLPQLTLESSQGPVSMRELSRDRLVLYVYPRAGRPGRPLARGWDDIPGARGCTPQSCAFREHAADLATMRDYFGRGGAGDAGPEHALADVRLRAPIVPKKFFHNAGNFREHENESKVVEWSHEIAPWIVFFQNVDAIVGPDDSVVYP